MSEATPPVASSKIILDPEEVPSDFAVEIDGYGVFGFEVDATPVGVKTGRTLQSGTKKPDSQISNLIRLPLLRLMNFVAVVGDLGGGVSGVDDQGAVGDDLIVVEITMVGGD